MFQFPGFALPHGSSRSSTYWVAPFRHPRINSCLQIPAAFRSLPRLSSPPDSLGILRSLFVPFSFSCPSVRPPSLRSGRQEGHCESHISVLLLPIEIVVRKFRFFARLFPAFRVRLGLRASQPKGCSGPRPSPSLNAKKTHRKILSIYQTNSIFCFTS